MEFATPWLPSAVFILCFITSAICAWLLMRSYLQVRSQMLFWSAACFVLLALNNLIIILDLFVVRGMDLGVARLAASLAAISVLIFGFIWRGDET
jgi:hypothetical protein